MVHVALADSSLAPARAAKKPGYFADTGIAALLASMATHGCHPGGEGLLAKLAGGARILEMGDEFDIGRKNLVAVRDHMKKLGVLILAEDVGGSISRTLEVDVDSNRVVVTGANRESWEI